MALTGDRAKQPKRTFQRHSRWHSGPKCSRVYVSGVGGNGVKVCCPACGAVADVQALGGDESLEASIKEST